MSDRSTNHSRRRRSNGWLESDGFLIQWMTRTDLRAETRRRFACRECDASYFRGEVSPRLAGFRRIRGVWTNREYFSLTADSDRCLFVWSLSTSISCLLFEVVWSVWNSTFDFVDISSPSVLTAVDVDSSSCLCSAERSSTFRRLTVPRDEWWQLENSSSKVEVYE